TKGVGLEDCQFILQRCLLSTRCLPTSGRHWVANESWLPAWAASNYTTAPSLSSHRRNKRCGRWSTFSPRTHRPTNRNSGFLQDLTPVRSNSFDGTRDLFLLAEFLPLCDNLVRLET